MAQLIVVRLDGAETLIDAEAGRSVMEIIRDDGIDELLAMCGGCCSCATCHVQVDAAFIHKLPAMGDEEREMLDSTGARQRNSRLACQLAFGEALDGLRVSVVAES